MRLRKPCEHGNYDEHYYSLPQGDGLSVWYPFVCPGGEFLPEDAELVELVCETIRNASALVEIPFRIATAFGEVDVSFGVLNLAGPALHDLAVSVVSALDTPADQVGEPG